MNRPAESNKDVVEELSKKSYEVVLPLDASTQKERKADFKQKSSGEESDQSDQDDDCLSDQEDDGSPKLNKWKGQNYKLHVLGAFDNDFQKRLMAFQIPETVQICTDPSGRSDVSCEYPPIEDAFLLWKPKPCRSGSIDCFSAKSDSFKFDSIEKEKDTNHNSLNSPDDNVQPLKILSLVSISSSEDEDDGDIKGDNCWEDDSESDIEPEISEYIKSQKLKKKSGVALTGETLVYDEEFEVIRNLHTSSISLSSYGQVSDNKIFGKTSILYDQLTPREKLMLSPIKSCKSSGDQKLFDVKAKIGKDSTISMNGDGAGDYDNDAF